MEAAESRECAFQYSIADTMRDRTTDWLTEWLTEWVTELDRIEPKVDEWMIGRVNEAIGRFKRWDGWNASSDY